jgi:transposase
MTRIVVADTRRQWSDEEKLAIVEESKTAPVARVARKHGVATSLLFRWRKQHGVEARLRRGRPRSADGFVRLDLPVAAVTDHAGCAAGSMEIVLGSGRRIIIGHDVDLAALRRVIDVLERP